VAVSSDVDSTSLSLLRRVRLRDHDAWGRLTTLYGPTVYAWCRRAGLQDNDAADAVQDVFRLVFQGIDQFRGAEPGGGSFRGWLWTISRNQIRLNYRKRNHTPQAIGGTDAQLRFAGQPDADLTEDEPDPVVTRRRLLHRALDLVQGDFNAATWQIFSRVTLQGHAIPDVARDLGLTENAVRQAKFRVLRRLREELDGGL
jgi:RNA polymerase sigma-70 factor (ECF subfamily)